MTLVLIENIYCLLSELKFIAKFSWINWKLYWFENRNIWNCRSLSKWMLSFDYKIFLGRRTPRTFATSSRVLWSQKAAFILLAERTETRSLPSGRYFLSSHAILISSITHFTIAVVVVVYCQRYREREQKTFQIFPAAKRFPTVKLMKKTGKLRAVVNL